MNDQAGKGGGAYANPRKKKFHLLGEFQVEHNEIDLNIAAKEIDDRAEEGRGYADLSNAYHSLGDFRKAIEYNEKRLKIAMEIGDQAGEAKAYRNLGIARLFLAE